MKTEEQFSYRMVIPGGGDFLIGPADEKRAKQDAQQKAEKHPGVQLWRTSEKTGGQQISYAE